MVAAKVIAKMFASQATPEWLSVGDTASSSSLDTASSLPAPIVWLGPVLLLVLSCAILLHIIIERRRQAE